MYDLNNNYVSLECVFKNPSKYVIKECVDVCDLLFSKNIEVYKTSTYDDKYLYVLVNNLSKENEKKINKLMKNDFKYFYDKKHDKYGIRVDEMSLGCSFELLVAANVFEMQDTLRYKNISKNDLENKNSKLYIDREKRLYENELFLNWHLRYNDYKKNIINNYIELLKINNNDNDISYIRDLFLKSEFDYLADILKDSKNIDFIRNLNKFSSEALIESAVKLMYDIDLGLYNYSKLESVEKEIILYLSAIKDKSFVKK